MLSLAKRPWSFSNGTYRHALEYLHAGKGSTATGSNLALVPGGTHLHHASCKSAATGKLSNKCNLISQLPRAPLGLGTHLVVLYLISACVIGIDIIGSGPAYEVRGRLTGSLRLPLPWPKKKVMPHTSRLINLAVPANHGAE